MEKREQIAKKIVEVAELLNEKNIRSLTEGTMLGTVLTDRLYLTFDCNENKITIKGNYPKLSNGTYYYPDLDKDIHGAIDADKTALQIANHIELHFMPIFLPLYVEAQRIVALEREYQDRKVQNALKLGLTEENLCRDKRYGTCIQDVRVKLKMSDKSIDMDISNVSVEKGLEILSILRREDIYGR